MFSCIKIFFKYIYLFFFPAHIRFLTTFFVLQQFFPPPLIMQKGLHVSVLAVESLHKTEICSGSSQSYDQIKPNQTSAKEPIYHIIKQWLSVFSVYQSIVGHLAPHRHWDVPTLCL